MRSYYLERLWDAVQRRSDDEEWQFLASMPALSNLPEELQAEVHAAAQPGLKRRRIPGLRAYLKAYKVWEAVGGEPVWRPFPPPNVFRYRTDEPRDLVSLSDLLNINHGALVLGTEMDGGYHIPAYFFYNIQSAAALAVPLRRIAAAIEHSGLAFDCVVCTDAGALPIALALGIWLGVPAEASTPRKRWGRALLVRTRTVGPDDIDAVAKIARRCDFCVFFTLFMTDYPEDLGGGMPDVIGICTDGNLPWRVSDHILANTVVQFPDDVSEALFGLSDEEGGSRQARVTDSFEAMRARGETPEVLIDEPELPKDQRPAPEIAAEIHKKMRRVGKSDYNWISEYQASLLRLITDHKETTGKKIRKMGWELEFGAPRDILEELLRDVYPDEEEEEGGDYPSFLPPFPSLLGTPLHRPLKGKWDDIVGPGGRVFCPDKAQFMPLIQPTVETSEEIWEYTSPDGSQYAYLFQEYGEEDGLPVPLTMVIEAVQDTEEGHYQFIDFTIALTPEQRKQCQRGQRRP